MRLLTFIESPTFTRQVLDLLSDDEYREFQTYLGTHPEAGDVIPGLRGLRKLRWAASGRGKRGGARCIYLFVPEGDAIFLFALYTKGDIADLNPDQKKRLLIAVEAIKNSYKR